MPIWHQRRLCPELRLEQPISFVQGPLAWVIKDGGCAEEKLLVGAADRGSPNHREEKNSTWMPVWACGHVTHTERHNGKQWTIVAGFRTLTTYENLAAAVCTKSPDVCPQDPQLKAVETGQG